MQMRRFFFFLAVSLFSTVFASAVFAVNLPEKPTPFRYVNDYVGLLTQLERESVEQIIRNFEAETSNEIAVVIPVSLEELDRFSYSQELFTKWGVGKKGKNNGVLFLIAPVEGMAFPEHADYFVNVGRGLEGALPDSLTGSILRSEFVPLFKDKKYGEAITKTVIGITQATKGEYTPSPGESSGGFQGGAINFFIWMGFIILSYLTSFLARTKSWWLGGVIGGVGGLILGFIFFTGLIIIAPAIGLALMGFGFDYLVSKNYQKRIKEGKPTDFWHSGGGFWGGGGGGGGFGGFGGGFSGGGGAGGRI